MTPPRGVTLLELVVALGLFALVLVGALALWEQGQAAFFAAADAAEVQQNLRTALDLIASEIRGAGQDATGCAFDYVGTGPGDCTGAKLAWCRLRLGPGYPITGCSGQVALPASDLSATGLRIRSDRNGNGTVAVAASGDAGEEDVRYALASGSPPCPPLVPRCITRDGGAGPAALVAVEVSALRFTYYPRPGYPPCAGSPPGLLCPAFGGALSQRDADNIGRITIAVTAAAAAWGRSVSRTLETDVVLATRE